MRPPRTSTPSSWLILAICLGTSIAGCGGGEKPVGDAQKYHPEGIGIDAEARKVPGTPKP